MLRVEEVGVGCRDYQAVKRGRVGKRIANKLIGRGVVRRLWR